MFERWKKKTELRNERDKNGLRFLGAEIQPNGDLVFNGQDIGPGVEKVLGSSEYEWYWTVKAEHISSLQQALGGGHIITLLETHFSGEKAAGLMPFMEAHHIPFESWYRQGD
jgi:hypothetical protein